MKIKALTATVTVTAIMALMVAATPPIAAQPSGIPSIGSASGTELSPKLERTLGDAIMEQGRRDPQYIAEPVINQYLTSLGEKLARNSSVPLNYDVTVFGLRDSSINAFALPGGYIGIHTGLLTAAESESELASVVAHEIAHVALRHVARGMAKGPESNHIMIASIVGAVLAGLAGGSSDLAMGVATFGQAAAVDRQLGFSRQAEKEADRAGYQMLSGAGYDPAGMERMFQRLQKSARLNEARGSYASTHPLSSQRLADTQGRTVSQANRQAQINESDEFWFVQAAAMVLQAQGGSALDRVKQRLRSLANSRSGAAQAAAYYGLAYAAMQHKDLSAAQDHLQQAHALNVDSAAIDVLEVELLAALDQLTAAQQHAEAARQQWPENQAVALALVEVLNKQNPEKAIPLLQQLVKKWPDEPRFFQLLARGLEQSGQHITALETMADYYILVGALPSAVDQLQQARQQSTDFYEQSTLDTKIRDLRERVERDRRLLERFKG